MGAPKESDHHAVVYRSFKKKYLDFMYMEVTSRRRGTVDRVVSGTDGEVKVTIIIKDPAIKDIPDFVDSVFLDCEKIGPHGPSIDPSAGPSRSGSTALRR